jgi:ketosteroid isomerase-like protein
MTPARWFSAGLVLVAVAAATFFLYPSETRRVRTRLDALAAAANVPARESDLERLTRTASLARFFTEDVTLDVGSDGLVIRGRDALVGLAAKAAVPPGGVVVELSEVEVAVDAATATAEATGTGRVTTTDPSTRQPSVDVRALAFTLHEVDGTWLVSSIRLRPPTPAPGGPQSRRRHPRPPEGSSRWS